MEWLNILRGAVLVVAPIGFFYQRDLPFTYLVSVDNTTWFFAYWLFIPMVIWYAIEKYGEDSQSGISSSNNRDEIDERGKKKIQEREYSLQKEREFIKEEVAKSRGYDSELQNQQIKYSKILPSRQTLIKDITWKVQASDLYSELKPDSRWYFKTKIDREAFEAYMFINDRDFKELQYKGVSVVNDYEEWLSSSEGRKWKKPSKFENSNTPKREPVKETKETIETTEDKLKKLKDLYDKKLISKEVYEKQQLEILSK